MRRSKILVASLCLIGTAQIPGSTEASAAGFARKQNAPVHSGMPSHPARYFRCRGGRVYTFQGGWGCDYYYTPYYLPRRR